MAQISSVSYYVPDKPKKFGIVTEFLSRKLQYALIVADVESCVSGICEKFEHPFAKGGWLLTQRTRAYDNIDGYYRIRGMSFGLDEICEAMFTIFTEEGSYMKIKVMIFDEEKHKISRNRKGPIKYEPLNTYEIILDNYLQECD
jgi:hypothetical protein